MTTTFSISRYDLAKALTIALKFPSKDDTLPMICGVDLAIIKGQLTLTATDRFRLGVVRVKPNPGLDGPNGRIGFMPHATATRLLRVIGGPLAGRPPSVAVSSVGASLTVADGETSITVSLSFEKFPDVAGILLGEMDRPIDLDLWGVNTAMFAAFKDAAWNKGDHASVRLSTPSHPAVVRIGDHFIGCLMPVRLTERGAPASDWREFLTPEPEPTPEPEKPKRAPRKAAAKRAPVKKSTAKRAPRAAK
ncbi:hypothetical protein ABH922_002761 [Rhodococcus sp. 27YEA15]|uniref:hypothetical protein n=1 Tax=Rhodococcus sp. 27YEA15 TaxID=3156259 RepID=UPI003C7DE5B7